MRKMFRKIRVLDANVSEVQLNSVVAGVALGEHPVRRERRQQRYVDHDQNKYLKNLLVSQELSLTYYSFHLL